MKTFIREKKRNGYYVPPIPPLESGDRMTRAEFERIYALHENIKAELIEGVVYVASPVFLGHSQPHADILAWAGIYRANTPRIRVADNQSVRLDLDNEVQPDVAIWVDGENAVPAGGYLDGAPEFVIEVARSSRSHDLGAKRKVYRRAGVKEYLVLDVMNSETSWFEREDERFVRIESENNIFRSKVFPGLWFDSDAFWDEDIRQVLTTLQMGIDSAEHTQFVKTLTA